jgi:hypothetical protein
MQKQVLLLLDSLLALTYVVQLAIKQSDSQLL